jgi:hypothetical protein
MMPQSVPDDGGRAEHRSVQEFITAVLREAELQADLAAEFLRANGIPPGKAPVHGDAPREMPKGALSDFTLAVGAALRIRFWERSEIKSRIAPELPPAAEVLVLAWRRACGELPGSSGGREISQAVLAVAMRGLCRRGLADIGADVLLPKIDPTALLEILSEFLWRHRDVMNKPEVEHGS